MDRPRDLDDLKRSGPQGAKGTHPLQVFSTPPTQEFFGS